MYFVLLERNLDSLTLHLHAACTYRFAVVDSVGTLEPRRTLHVTWEQRQKRHTMVLLKR